MSLEDFKKSQSFTRRSNNLAKMGYDFNNDVQEEYHRFRDKIADLYLIQGESMPSLMKLFGIPSSKTLFLLFKTLDIDTRSLSDAGSIAHETGRSAVPPGFTFNAKQEWHTSWSGERCFLRSSYEKEFAEQLDKEQIEYKTEAFRIRYFDSTVQKSRVAVPDFYLPKENKIVEIKASYWYDEQQMSDRFRRYEELGFKTMLVLDRKVVGLEGNAPS